MSSRRRRSSRPAAPRRRRSSRPWRHPSISPAPPSRDGTDHTRPATLRGLAPDQVLVLVNGKRRHTSALINVNGSIGRGSGMVDLNAIPASAIERIEILRDGAAAQYGSDAIAGVINIILKEGAPNELRTTLGQTVESDGEVIKAAGNYALARGRRRCPPARGRVPRPRASPTGRSAICGPSTSPAIRGTAIPAFNGQINHRQGDADTEDVGLFLNLAKPVGEATEVYAFGGGTLRSGESAGFFRRALDDRTVRAIYPNGFLPIIGTKISDFSGVAGLRGDKAGWRWDLSADYGRNLFHFDVRNSANVTLGAASPTEFYAGTLIADQFTANLDLAKSFDVGLASPLNVAVGRRVPAGRLPDHRGRAGQLPRWRRADSRWPERRDARARPGAQVFPGFRPADATEQEPQQCGRVRRPRGPGRAASCCWESRDGWSTTTISAPPPMARSRARFEPMPGFAVRGAISHRLQGAVAGPIVVLCHRHQLHQRRADRQPDFPGDQPRRPGARCHAAHSRRQSTNYSFGVALNPVKDLSLTADYYQILIDDRIVFSGNFTGRPVRTFLEGQGFPGVAGGAVLHQRHRHPHARRRHRGQLRVRDRRRPALSG